MKYNNYIMSIFFFNFIISHFNYLLSINNSTQNYLDSLHILIVITLYNSHFIILLLVYNRTLNLIYVRILFCHEHILVFNHFTIVTLFLFGFFYASIVLKRFKFVSVFLAVDCLSLKSVQVTVHLRSLRGLYSFFITAKNHIFSLYELVTLWIINKFRCWRSIH